MHQQGRGSTIPGRGVRYRSKSRRADHEARRLLMTQTGNSASRLRAKASSARINKCRAPEIAWR